MDISPDNQNVDRVFSNTTYYIDFYQRQYKWNDVPVKRLLEDVFYRFNEEYEKFKDSDIPLNNLINRFGWYYLNTYVTNNVDGKLYVVDGQQRLTTLTLILIKLLHQAKTFNSKLEDWIKNKITGHSGYQNEFWIDHEEHKNTLLSLLDGVEFSKIDTTAGITSINMVANYQIINKWLDIELQNMHRYESFVFYFLNRLVLIKLNVEQTEVPMVFEVINDRGVRLKPYEILKGKLLGQIEKYELKELRLNEIWDEQVKKINDFKDDEIDEFFIYFLKAKLTDTRGLAQKFDKEYHRVMFEDEYDKKLKLKHNPKGVKKFIQNDFVYYTNLYVRILENQKAFTIQQPYVYYNYLTDMNTQFLLILSGCALNDEREAQKIFEISRLLDRMFCLLQLQRSYDSNAFATDIYKLSAEIRDQSVENIKEIFEKFLLKNLSEARGSLVENSFNYGYFKETGMDLDKRFKRYFFARVESFIAESTNMKMKHTLYDLVQNTGTRNGFHIEHILSNNNENKMLFNNDEETFERERNRLSGLLLLKGRDNISSNNESFSKKLRSYANTLYWNETLREDTYKSKLDFDGMMGKYNLTFRPMDSFGPKELEERQRLLFKIVKIIWK